MRPLIEIINTDNQINILQMTHQEVITAMKSIQDKQISRQTLTAEEIKMQKFHFNYGLHNGAKEYLKSISK